MIFDKHANLKYKFENRYFWAEGYYVSTVESQLENLALQAKCKPPLCGVVMMTARGPVRMRAGTQATTRYAGV